MIPPFTCSFPKHVNEWKFIFREIESESIEDDGRRNDERGPTRRHRRRMICPHPHDQRPSPLSQDRGVYIQRLIRWAYRERPGQAVQTNSPTRHTLPKGSTEENNFALTMVGFETT